MSDDLSARISAAFATPPSILDGGLGAELLDADVDLERDLESHERCVELLNVNRPDLVRQTHASFLEAGAQWLTTNTFCADPASLEKRGLGERCDELTRAAVAICRGVAASDSLVLGSVGPGLGTAPPAASATRAFLECLVDAGADGLLLETQMSLDTLRALLREAEAVRKTHASDLFLMVSCVVDSHGNLPAAPGNEERELPALLRDHGVDLFALNCSSGCEPLSPALERLREAWPARFGIYPNAGVPTSDEAGSLRYPIGPGEFAAGVQGLQRKFELDLIGGCCGASPAHIRALRS